MRANYFIALRLRSSDFEAAYSQLRTTLLAAHPLYEVDLLPLLKVNIPCLELCLSNEEEVAAAKQCFLDWMQDILSRFTFPLPFLLIFDHVAHCPQSNALCINLNDEELNLTCIRPFKNILVNAFRAHPLLSKKIGSLWLL